MGTTTLPVFKPRQMNSARLPVKRKLVLVTRLFLMLSLFLSALSIKAFSQNSKVIISGQVTDAAGQPMIGVTVRLKGTDIATQTGETGSYQISVSVQQSKEGTLLFTYIGVKAFEQLLTGATTYNITMESETVSLEDVVAIGYGVAKKKDLSGAISTVEGKELASRNASQLTQALQGAMPGVTVTRTNSLPGGSGTIRVRGVTTIGDSDPLIIVDGVPVSNIDDINPSDIQDISVLKDAASASIYGSRAAAGVILITTNRPHVGQLSLKYQGDYGSERATARPEPVDVTRYLQMMNELSWNDAGNAAGSEFGVFTEDQVNNWVRYNKEDPNNYPITDWEALLMNKTAQSQRHNLTLSGGSDKVRSMASFNYEHRDALYNYRSYERVTARINNTFHINKYLSATADFSYNYSLTKLPSTNPIWTAVNYPAIYPALWADGRIAGGKNGSNAYASLNYGGFDNTWQNKLYGQVSVKLEPITGLSLTGVLSPRLNFTKEKDFNKQIAYFNDDDPTQFAGYIGGHETTDLYETRNDAKSLTKQLIANYIKKAGDHNFNLMAGYEDNYNFNEGLTAQGTNYVLSNFPYLDLAPLDYMQNTGNATETAYRSYFGRLMYDYNSKYFLQANIRYDGSSRFAKAYRWGSFPSVSAAWAVTEEKFMKNQPVFSYLKLRGSWGQLGNERIGNYPYQSSITYSNALMYQNGAAVSQLTAAQVAYAIQNITWETTETSNLGIDASFLQNRLSLSFDIYKKTTKDMLLELEIPDYMGYSNPDQNTGKMFTNGWDLQLGYKDRIGDFSYGLVFNLSDSKSKMGYLGGIVLDGSTIIRQGSEYAEWYGYKSAGIYQTQDEVDNSATLNGSVQPGDIKYLDISGPDGVPDGVISPEYDRVLLGGSLPRMLYSGTLNAAYKGFDFGLVLQGVGKQNVMFTEDMVRPFATSGYSNPPKIIDGKYWSVYNTEAENQKAVYPRLSQVSGNSNNYVNSDYWMFSGAYFRVKLITLGYTLPEKLMQSAKIKAMRVYASYTDPFSLSHYPQGWDPEAQNNTYITKVLNLGVSIEF